MKNLFLSPLFIALVAAALCGTVYSTSNFKYFVFQGRRVTSIPKAEMKQSISLTPSYTNLAASKGRQPKVLLTEEGTVNLVFGWENTIYFKRIQLASDKLNHTAKPNSIQSDTVGPGLVATLPEGLMLGMGRGPQLATREKNRVIAAVDKKGNLYSWRQKENGNGWQGPFRINDRDGVAQEGFVALVAGAKGRFYAFWNDLRSGNNQIYGAVSSDQGQSWQKSQLVYASSDTTICECCKVSATTDQNGNVYLMWRNQLNGYRDMYILTLDQNLKSKTEASKLGNGSWQLKGCPMDGGNLTVTPSGKVITVWRRESKLYSCQPGKTEKLLADGRNPVIAATDKMTAIAWNTGQQIFYQWIDEKGDKQKSEKQTQAVTIGNGIYPSLATNGQQTVVCWESVNGEILYQSLPTGKNQLY
ncbi:sialidase family protein [Cytophagaceae bacterium YF14B1]|uniref:Sialidase family protein n=1 Tax=Xanthocytophaga flava TaxID=3048013 RepID=A0AAE3QQ01_9BACT|nr:sialidase family protein [Xanthocytophaga flavus]MDJ1482766.1 sialidase family protein [Xanthocytophaga flavus]